MGMAFRIIAVLLVVGGVWVWVTGRSVTTQTPLTVPSTTLSASVAAIPRAEVGPFNEEGTIVVDANEGPGGTVYILYTRYNDAGNPVIRTKRLVFERQAECDEANLACATPQQQLPFAPEEKVRVIGYMENERVKVSSIERL